MAEHQYTANEDWTVGIDAASERGFRTIAYKGTLGGGTLQVKTTFTDNVNAIPVADAKLSASKLDGNGDVIQQMTFQADGLLVVSLTGATTPNVWVAVK